MGKFIPAVEVRQKFIWLIDSELLNAGKNRAGTTNFDTCVTQKGIKKISFLW